MEKRKVQSLNGTTYYWIGGNTQTGAPCIVLCHGITADHTMFDKQTEYFGKDYRVLTWDLPLHGESKPYENATYETAVDELKSILDIENIGRVILVGQSLGGYVCQAFALRYHQIVQAFVAVDTTPFGHYSKTIKWSITHAGMFVSCYSFAALVKAMVNRAADTEYARGIYYSAVSKLSKNEIKVVMDRYYGDLFNGGYFTRKETVKYDFPVLLILGENDAMGYVVKMTKLWAAQSRYSLKIIKDAAHASNVDNHIEFNKTVGEFLSGLKA